MQRPADVQLHPVRCEVVRDLMRVPDGAGQPVKFRHHEGVAASARGQRFTQSWAVRVAASEAMIDIDTIWFDAHGRQGIPLDSEVLFVGGNPCVANLYFNHEQEGPPHGWQCAI
ncbi:hypothetical protein ABIE00_002174 [Arthrobacter sp. OAP107]